MANKVITVLDRQSIWDIAVQEYGSVEGVKQLMIDNPTKCNFETDIGIGTKLFITQTPINNKVYDYMVINKIKPCTAIEQYMSSWILATSLWDDSNFWDDNALWIY